ncbi:MAG: MFS transporter [Opitutae bacterium]|nr:MFS transporter [Opitutae bacterium]
MAVNLFWRLLAAVVLRQSLLLWGKLCVVVVRCGLTVLPENGKCRADFHERAMAKNFALTGTDLAEISGAGRRRFRVVVGIFYFMQGIVFGSWASRIPDIKAMLGMSEADLGSVLFAIPLGQLLAMPFSGWLTAKIGSRACTGIAVAVYGLALTLIALAAGTGSRAVFFASLVFFGVCGNLHNIAINTQGVGVERIYGRSIMAGFHGVWSLAGFASGLISTTLVSAGISPVAHFAGVYAACAILMAFLIRFAIPSDASKQETVRELRENSAGKNAPRRRRFALSDPFILLLGVICFVNMGCEGVMFDWSGVYFQQVVRPDESLVRLGYTVALGAMAAGRFVADRFVMRFGQVRVIQVCATMSACGLLLSVALPQTATAAGGFMLVGFGISSIVPVCYSLSSRAENIPVGVAIASVSTIGFLGFLFGPPVIGHTAEFLGNLFASDPAEAPSVGLRGAFLCAAFFALLSAVVAPKINKFISSSRGFSGDSEAGGNSVREKNVDSGQQ